MRRYNLIYIRLLWLTVLVLAVSVSSLQREEFPSNCLQEEWLTEEDTDRYLSATAGLKVNAGSRMIPVCVHGVRQQREGTIRVVADSSWPNVLPSSPPADRCRLYCIYRL